MVGALGTEIQRPLPKFKWFPGSTTRLRVGGNIYRREYSGAEFDDSNYGIYAGPRFISNKGQMSVLSQADRRRVNGRPYSRRYGLRIEGVRLITQRIWAGGSVEGSRQTALGTNGPIGKAGLSWNTHAFVHYTILPSLSVRFMGGTGREPTDRFSTRHRSRWGGVMGTYDLPLGFTVTAAQLGMDGTGVPVRKSETAGRRGKQEDGSARTREVKLVVVWTAESTHPKTGRPRRDRGSVSYAGAIESAASRDTDPEPSAFAQRVWREAARYLLHIYRVTTKWISCVPRWVNHLRIQGTNCLHSRRFDDGSHVCQP